MFRNIFIITCFLCAAFCDEYAVVEICNGKLRGSFNDQYYSFKGIPYAEPPIGENRFESPKPFLNKWSGIRDATMSGDACISINTNTESHQISLLGAEDCLFVNVYTPKIKTNLLLPSIFYIHGGSFRFGSGDYYNESILMNKKKFVLVTFNYRLGPLGFMSTEDGEIAGNMGLKDQRLALEWVHQNIENFGGDPKHILMIGFSSGGASVEYQLLQPDVENFVKAAFSISGSALNPWALNSNVLEKVKKVANILKCNTESTREIKNCLKQISATDIVNTTNEFFVYNYHPLIVWAPSIESTESKDPMLLETPRELIKKGKTAKIPYLSSYTNQEGGIFVSELLYKKENGTTDLEYFNKNYKQILPSMFFYEDRFENISELDQYTENLYKNSGVSNSKITMENFEKLIKIATEELISNGVKESWHLHNQYSPSKIYCYQYDYAGNTGLGAILTKKIDLKVGCVHGEDFLLLFSHPIRKAEDFTDTEKKHFDNFIKLLETFIQTGVPQFNDLVFPENKHGSEIIEYVHILENEVLIESDISIL